MTKASEETRVVRLRLICRAPLPSRLEGRSTEFGLQDKHQLVHPGFARTDGSIQYELDVSVKRDRQTNALCFLGPWVHGTATVPFLYLSWRWTEPELSPWIKRLKIPLTAITWEQVEAVGHGGGTLLEATVSGSGGGTVPVLEGGWTAIAARDD